MSILEKIIPHDAYVIGVGTRSVCYRSGNYVYKEMPAHSIKEYSVLVKEYDLLKKFLNGYVHDTEFFVQESGRGLSSIIAKQEFIEGRQLYDFVLAMNYEEDIEIRNFFMSCIAMYDNVGLVPDIFGRPHGVGWYNPLTTPNVLVTNSDHRIKLLDVGISRLSKTKAIGLLHNFLLSQGIKNYLSK